jgi:hypothetical protein
VSVPPESLPLRLGTRVIEGYFNCPTAFAVTTSAVADENVIVIGGHRDTDLSAVRIRGRGVVCGRCRAVLRAIGVLAVHSGRDLSRWATDE